mgnify:CR=1 FL=1
MNWFKQKMDKFLENPGGYIRLAIIILLISFAIYSLDKEYLKGADQWWFIGGIILLIIYFIDDNNRH